MVVVAGAARWDPYSMILYDIISTFTLSEIGD